jgi:hypothetical protein
MGSVRPAPSFALAVVGVLALGTGANIAIFSIVNAVLSRQHVLRWHAHRESATQAQRRTPQQVIPQCARWNDNDNRGLRFANVRNTHTPGVYMRSPVHLVVVGLSCVALAVCAASVDLSGAQTHEAALRVTVIGCVQRSQPAGGDITGTTVIPAGETRYVLSNITLVPDNSQSGGGANVVAESVRLYRLDDASDSLIAPHVGDRVRVKGTIVQPPPSPAGTAGNTSPAEAPRAPMLRVDSLQTISSRSTVCSR